ncbi:MAG: bifunctional glutamate N-acetyltransferase/amino-acid acetyltransferase ArgJ [Solirubrobacterales bacterium]
MSLPESTGAPPPITDIPPLLQSRWTELPEATTELDSATLPSGFRAAGIAAGIKPSGKIDFGMIVSDGAETASSARFTVSSAPAAPVQVCRTRVELNKTRAVIVNSGNANAATGPTGRDNAFYMQGAGAMAAALPESQVAVASTGVIGRQLDTRALSKGATAIVRELRHDGALDFANAIMTTDLWPKLGALSVALSGGTVTLSAQAKGAGMIAPMHGPALPHATLLCFVQTDARMTAATADRLLGAAVARSFDRITVDGQLSTNDSVFFMAGGESGVSVAANSDDERLMQGALDTLLLALAISIVRDGEGAERIGRVTVYGGDAELCEKTARAIGDSPLVKTALNSGDPNWGRIMQAAGAALATGKPEPIEITIERVSVASSGIRNDFDQAVLDQAVSGREVEYEVRIPGEGASATLYFSDLGHPYVTLNAEYTT